MDDVSATVATVDGHPPGRDGGDTGRSARTAVVRQMVISSPVDDDGTRSHDTTAKRRALEMAIFQHGDCAIVGRAVTEGSNLGHPASPIGVRVYGVLPYSYVLLPPVRRYLLRTYVLVRRYEVDDGYDVAAVQSEVSRGAALSEFPRYLGFWFSLGGLHCPCIANQDCGDAEYTDTGLKSSAVTTELPEGQKTQGPDPYLADKRSLTGVAG